MRLISNHNISKDSQLPHSLPRSNPTVHLEVLDAALVVVVAAPADEDEPDARPQPLLLRLTATRVGVDGVAQAGHGPGNLSANSQ